MIISVDVDGVLRDFISSLNIHYDRNFPDETRNKFVHDWNLHKSYSIGHRIYKYAFEDNAKSIFTNALPYPGARNFMEEIFKEHEVVISTSQQNSISSFTLDWLNKNRIPFHHYHSTSNDNKDIISSDVLLDDKPDNLRNFSGVSVCMGRTWNTEWSGVKVFDYDEFLDLLPEIEKML